MILIFFCHITPLLRGGILYMSDKCTATTSFRKKQQHSEITLLARSIVKVSILKSGTYRSEQLLAVLWFFLFCLF